MNLTIRKYCYLTVRTSKYIVVLYLNFVKLAVTRVIRPKVKFFKSSTVRTKILIRLEHFPCFKLNKIYSLTTLLNNIRICNLEGNRINRNSLVQIEKIHYYDILNLPNFIDSFLHLDFPNFLGMHSILVLIKARGNSY